ncbi:gamma-glutamyltranspeptidase [Klebsiella pneumoniae]|nr:gamma-glutamyltranspeptidase [Klebsiella pneumoniae]
MIKTTIWRQVVIAALLAGGSFTVAANPPPPPPVSYGVEEDVFHPVRARQGMVASVDALATRVGVDILRQGGNAVDAAVAVGYALAVTHPQAGNIGGGGFMMLRLKTARPRRSISAKWRQSRPPATCSLTTRATRTVKNH